MSLREDNLKNYENLSIGSRFTDESLSLKSKRGYDTNLTSSKIKQPIEPVNTEITTRRTPIEEPKKISMAEQIKLNRKTYLDTPNDFDTNLKGNGMPMTVPTMSFSSSNNETFVRFIYDEMLTNNLYADSLLMGCFNLGNLKIPNLSIESTYVYDIKLSDKIRKYYKNLDQNINTLETLVNNGIAEDKAAANNFIDMLQKYNFDLDTIIIELKELRKLNIKTNSILEYYYELFRDEKLEKAYLYSLLLAELLSYLMLIISVSYIYKYYDLFVNIATKNKDILNNSAINTNNKENLLRIKPLLITYVKEYYKTTGTDLINLKFTDENTKLKPLDDVINFNYNYKIENMKQSLETSSDKIIEDFQKCLNLIEDDGLINYLKNYIINPIRSKFNNLINNNVTKD